MSQHLMVIFNQAARELAIGLEFDGSGLDPRALANGTEWVADIAVLDDPGFDAAPLSGGPLPWPYTTGTAWLNSLPTRIVDTSEFPPQPPPMAKAPDPEI
jgi:hypothetical protein